MKRIISIIFLAVIVSFSSNILANVKAKELKRNGKKLIASSSSFSYKWYFNNQIIEGVNGNSIVILKAGEYRVEMINADGSTSVEVFNTLAVSSPRKLFVIGDSTASIYDASRFPRTGWGQILQAFFNTDSILVIDKALSGRSSKSFYTDAAGWPVVLKALGSGDFLFIQFAHNDEKSTDTARYTEPYTTFQKYLSIYIDSARRRGALPVLLTPIHRNNWSGDQINDSHGDYPPAMRDLAVKKKVPLIDLTIKTEQLFESAGIDYTTNRIFLNINDSIYATYPGGIEDNTHTQLNGAFEICKLISAGIDTITTNDTVNFLKNSLVKTGIVEFLSHPFNAGTLTGAGVYPVGKNVSLKATQKSGFLFSKIAEKDTLVSTINTYSFIMSENPRTFGAYFLPAYKVTLQQLPLSSATLSGGGYYGKDSLVKVGFVAKEGYKFTNWTVNGEIVSIDTVYSFIMNDSNITITANFELLLTLLNENNRNGFEVFPNPFNDKLIFRSESKILRIELLDLNGRLIVTKSCDSYECYFQDLIKISEMQVIIAKIITDKQIYTCKLQKML